MIFRVINDIQSSPRKERNSEFTKRRFRGNDVMRDIIIEVLRRETNRREMM
jgi:hypothetical protein